MKKSKVALLATASASMALVGFALYLQHADDMLPCPLCVIQRYAFILFAIGCLVCLSSSMVIRKIGIFIGFISAILGGATALYQLYVIQHPDIKCGVDPIQTAVNNLPFADWVPSIFFAEGICGTYYDPILGLSVPEWSLVWFIIFIVLLFVEIFRAKSID